VLVPLLDICDDNIFHCSVSTEVGGFQGCWRRGRRVVPRVLAAWFDLEGSSSGGHLGCHWHARLNGVGLERGRRNLANGICNKIEYRNMHKKCKKRTLGKSNMQLYAIMCNNMQEICSKYAANMQQICNICTLSKSNIQLVCNYMQLCAANMHAICRNMQYIIYAP
jgi:hypothetical protein